MESIELRLYYDDKGNVLFYTCDKPEGNFIVIDKQTFAESRPDLKVVNDKLVRPGLNPVVAKLIPNDDGISCAKDDVSIVTTDDVEIQKWKLVINEF
jgi:hypothetical protein